MTDPPTTMPPIQPFHNAPSAAVSEDERMPTMILMRTRQDHQGHTPYFPFVSLSCFFLLLNQDTPLVITVVPFSSFFYSSVILFLEMATVIASILHHLLCRHGARQLTAVHTHLFMF